jgi:hypothetical protein
MYTLATELTEYSYLSLFHISGADTIFYLKKRMVCPGKKATMVPVTESRYQPGWILRVEPTYSSYTYNWKDIPVQFVK